MALVGRTIVNSLIISDYDASSPASRKLLTITPGGTAGTTTAIVGSQTSNRTLTLPDATDTLVGKATTDTFTNKTFDVDGTGNSLSNVANANIKAGAGIVYSKLNLSDSIVNADINSSAAIAYSKLNLSDSIVNADINASAAIAYSKLNLSDSIVNADINASAAIAYSKLNLSDSIVNADINSSAAIAYSKLNLSDSIVNADINASAAIAYSKLNLNGNIVNADINASAAIAYSKLASLTDNRVLVSSSNAVSASSVTTTELGLLSGVTGTLVTEAGTQTLTNKTLASPDITTEASFVNQAEARFYEQTGNGTNYVGFEAPDSVTSNLVWKLPDGDGSADQVLKTDGSGELGWATAVTNPMTTSGDIIVGGTSGAPGRLAAGSDGDFLKISSGTPTWETPSGYRLGSIQVFTSAGSTTWTRPAGCLAVRVIAVGGGGAGGGASVTTALQYSAGSGGGAGGTGIKFITSPAASETVVVGAAGAQASGANGGSGGQSYFDDATTVAGNGGGGGTSLSAGTGSQGVSGGTGATGVGDVVITGGEGAGGWQSGSADIALGGAGGASYLGSGGSDRIGYTTISFAGRDGVAPGSGGGGAAHGKSKGTGSAGGNGAPGIVIVEEYY